MKKLCIFLTLAMLICLLTACGSASPSDTSASSKPTEPTEPTELTKPTEPTESSPSATESTQTDVLYAFFGVENVKEYPIEYTGAKKNAEELAHELSELTGLDFIITASQADDGWIVDWAADSTLIAGRDDREQKEEFFFFDQNTLSWFMMDSLWRTLTENLNAENIYYTMDGGKELVLVELYPVNKFPSDIAYMGSAFYFAHTDVGDNEVNPYQGFWEYPDGKILEINGEEWNLYAEDGITVLDHGQMDYAEDAAWLMNEDGSSGGGRVYFDENNNLIDSGRVLTYLGLSIDDVPKG